MGQFLAQGDQCDLVQSLPCSLVLPVRLEAETPATAPTRRLAWKLAFRAVQRGYDWVLRWDFIHHHEQF